MIFFQDNNLVDEYKKIKQKQEERLRADSRNTVQNVDQTEPTIKEELKVMKRKARRKDCYSIVTENLSHNPFMTKIMKSSDFTPEPGVKHTDNI